MDTMSDPHQAPMDAEAMLKAKLRHQVEYYFSPDNLSRDTYLQSQMDADKYVPLHLIAQFNKVKSLTQHQRPTLLIECLRESTSVQLDPSETRIKARSPTSGSTSAPKRRSVLILREIPSTTSRDQVEALFTAAPASKCPPIESCEFAGNDNWYIAFSGEEDAQLALHYLKEDVQTFLGRPILARIKAHLMPRSTSSSTAAAAGTGTAPTQPPATPTPPPVPPTQPAQLSPKSVPKVAPTYQPAPYYAAAPAQPPQFWPIGVAPPPLNPMVPAQHSPHAMSRPYAPKAPNGTAAPYKAQPTVPKPVGVAPALAKAPQAQSKPYMDHTMLGETPVAIPFAPYPYAAPVYPSAPAAIFIPSAPNTVSLPMPVPVAPLIISPQNGTATQVPPTSGANSVVVSVLAAQSAATTSATKAASFSSASSTSSQSSSSASSSSHYNEAAPPSASAAPASTPSAVPSAPVAAPVAVPAPSQQPHQSQQSAPSQSVKSETASVAPKGSYRPQRTYYNNNNNSQDDTRPKRYSQNSYETGGEGHPPRKPSRYSNSNYQSSNSQNGYYGAGSRDYGAHRDYGHRHAHQSPASGSATNARADTSAGEGVDNHQHHQHHHQHHYDHKPHQNQHQPHQQQPSTSATKPPDWDSFPPLTGTGQSNSATHSHPNNNETANYNTVVNRNETSDASNKSTPNPNQQQQQQPKANNITTTKNLQTLVITNKSINDSNSIAKKNTSASTSSSKAQMTSASTTATSGPPNPSRGTKSAPNQRRSFDKSSSYHGEHRAPRTNRYSNGGTKPTRYSNNNRYHGNAPYHNSSSSSSNNIDSAMNNSLSNSSSNEDINSASTLTSNAAASSGGGGAWSANKKLTFAEIVSKPQQPLSPTSSTATLTDSAAQMTLSEQHQSPKKELQV